MKQIKRQLFESFVLVAVGGLAIAPAASAVDFTFTTIQERSNEVVEIDDLSENFRELQQEQLNQETEAVQDDNEQPLEASDSGNGSADTLRLTPVDEDSTPSK